MEAPGVVQEGPTEQRVLLLVSGSGAGAGVQVLPDTASAKGLVQHSPAMLHFWQANASTGAAADCGGVEEGQRVIALSGLHCDCACDVLVRKQLHAVAPAGVGNGVSQGYDCESDHAHGGEVALCACHACEQSSAAR